MAKTAAQLQKENDALKKEIETLRSSLNSKSKLCDALFKKHECSDPEEAIINILEVLQIPEQVAILKQVGAKKLLQFRIAHQRAANAAKFYSNNIADLESAFIRAAQGDIVLPPEAS